MFNFVSLYVVWRVPLVKVSGLIFQNNFLWQFLKLIPFFIFDQFYVQFFIFNLSLFIYEVNFAFADYVKLGLYTLDNVLYRLNLKVTVFSIF